MGAAEGHFSSNTAVVEGAASYRGCSSIMTAVLVKKTIAHEDPGLSNGQPCSGEPGLSDAGPSGCGQEPQIASELEQQQPEIEVDIGEVYPNIQGDHLVKLLEQLLKSARQVAKQKEAACERGTRYLTAADGPTLLGSGAFSLLEVEREARVDETPALLRHLRWPRVHSDVVLGLRLREQGAGFIGGRSTLNAFTRTTGYAVVKPALLLDRLQHIKTLRGHRNAVYCAVFDKTGRYVVTGSDDRLVKIWSMETGLCLRSCRGHSGDITDLAVSCDNRLVASASNDHTIRVWDLPRGMPVSVLMGHSLPVTAIAFSPRWQSPNLLLSSSEDGTCRIWDARDSSLNSRVYMPSLVQGQPVPRSQLPVQPGNLPGEAPSQILCCAFNADGTIFVTGSADKLARVWDARKWQDDITGRPNFELDVLRGHENDVNYVQFRAPALGRRAGRLAGWLWVHGKAGSWQLKYHLKVPPPPLPPASLRVGGGRQKLLNSPTGVNMIVWSLDNKYVLASIMDCRICVWNAGDGKLLHSLHGHSKQTYVLDVHPFDPRLAMSAGYDGKVIIWDIKRGVAVKEFCISSFQLVDGHFSPDGTSLIVSDEVGQIYFVSTGGEAQWPLAQEDQVSGTEREGGTLSPYPEPFQSIFQQRRLGALGISWQPYGEELMTGIP
eukprot:jgi/Mesen1/9002/ME000056S08408